ncbi:hypothetical protein C1645_876149 [Glomus cerebriforme]|uniref:HMG box domain-containing protein n=1 Tax=Glomus cerebriforme TaxID=658196 RepID=A0A397T5P8_9GLOM|nr:hypothetical protein C1645_876149 [Glomus cerebriforme]
MPPLRPIRPISPPPPPMPQKNSNCYIIFYTDFYKKILDKEFPNLSPQEKAIKAGEKWNSLSDELKNSFIEYANNKRLLKNLGLSMKQQLVFNPKPKPKMDDLRIIFDDRCHKVVRSNEVPQENDDYICNKMFHEFINEDAYSNN